MGRGEGLNGSTVELGSSLSSVQINASLPICTRISHQPLQLAPPSSFTDTSAFVGDIDEDKDGSLDYSDIKAEPLHEVRF